MDKVDFRKDVKVHDVENEHGRPTLRDEINDGNMKENGGSMMDTNENVIENDVMGNRMESVENMMENDGNMMENDGNMMENDENQMESDESIMENDGNMMENDGNLIEDYGNNHVSNTDGKNPEPEKTSETSSHFSTSGKRNTSPIKIDAAIRCQDNYSLYTAEPKSLPSPLPSHFGNHEDLFQEETRRKTVAYLSSDTIFDQKPNYRRDQEGCKSIKYTSLKSEIRKKSKTQQNSKQNVKDLGEKKPDHRNSFLKEEKSPKNDKNKLSVFGIHEEVFKCCLGDWILTDLDLNVYEMEQAQDVTYLREKRKRKRVTILGMRRCWFL